MGREFPIGSENAAENHPFISMSLFIASIAATIAIVSSLCGALSRKKPPSSPSGAEKKIKENRDVNIPSPTSDNDHGSPATDTSLTIPPQGSDSDNGTRNEEFSQQPLPPPPGMRHLPGAASQHYRSNSTASSSSSKKKLPTSMSMRALGNGIGITSRQSSKRDQDSYDDHNSKKKDKKLKHEDSIWKKTIILGEKCKVPDEDDDDAILYDEKGNRISTYHRKSTSLALSRQSSSIDPDAIPSFEGQKNEIQRIS